MNLVKIDIKHPLMDGMPQAFQISARKANLCYKNKEKQHKPKEAKTLMNNADIRRFLMKKLK
jgi:hypothetical protein